MECQIAGPGCLDAHLVSVTTTDVNETRTTKVACIACAVAVVPIYARGSSTILVEALPPTPGLPLKVPESVGESKVYYNGMVTKFGATWLRDHGVTCPQCGLPFPTGTIVRAMWGGYLFHSHERGAWASRIDGCAEAYKQPFLERARDLAERYLPYMAMDDAELRRRRRYLAQQYADSLQSLASVLIEHADTVNLDDLGHQKSPELSDNLTFAVANLYRYIVSYLVVPAEAHERVKSFLSMRAQLNEVADEHA